MKTAYKPIHLGFHHEIEVLIEEKKYIAIQYFTDIHEFITTRAIIKEIFLEDDSEYMRLSTGEEIRLDQVVKIQDSFNPGHNIEEFTCDC